MAMWIRKSDVRGRLGRVPRVPTGAAFIASLICIASLPPVEASAAGVVFDGDVDATCTLTVDSNGTLAVSTDLQSMSSKNPGGAAGQLTLSTTGGVDLSVDPVSSVTVPSADVSSTTWTPTFSVSGAHTVAETGSTTTLTDSGTSTVDVNLEGTKSGNDRFAAGTYQATVTVRCE